MTQSKFNLFILPLLLALAGCGGHSGSSEGAVPNPPNTSADAFVGTWRGTYRAASGEPSGTISLTIARDPTATGLESGVRVTGTAQDATYGAATVTGFVYDDPRADGYAGGSGIALAYAAGNGDGFVGRPSVSAASHLVGPLFKIVVDAREPVTLDLAPVAQ